MLRSPERRLPPPTAYNGAPAVDYAKRLRSSALKIEADGTPSQVGMSPEELRDAADAMDDLRRSLGRIASKNDLSAGADADLQTRASVAFGALAECEMLARNALDD